jgi:hypothetical protein
MDGPVPEPGRRAIQQAKGSNEMTHRLKALGLALVAVFAMSAVAASAASAAGVFETSTGSSATITGEQISGTVTEKTVTKHEFTTTVGTVKCSIAKFHGVMSSPSTELTLTPTYEECLIAGNIPATVDMNGCDYKFTAGETVGGSSDVIEVSVHVECPPSAEIVVTVVGTTCKIKIPRQTLTGITAENTTAASPVDIDAIVDVTGIEYTVENGAGPAKCPKEKVGTELKEVPDGTYTNGTYKGVATLKGEEVGGGAAVGVTVT